MQREFTESWSKLYQCINKPMVDLTELNISTINNMTKNAGSLDELTKVKKPEELLAAQTRLANAACQEAARYTQKAMDISLNAFTETGKIWAEMLQHSTMKATDMAKMGTVCKGKE